MITVSQVLTMYNSIELMFVGDFFALRVERTLTDRTD